MRLIADIPAVPGMAAVTRCRGVASDMGRRLGLSADWPKSILVYGKTVSFVRSAGEF